MPFPNLRVTNAGKAMMLSVLSGAPLKFTRIVLGDGNAPTNQDVLTAVQAPKGEGVIDDYVRDGTVAKAHWVLDAQTVTRDFDWTEYGLYASITLDSNGDVVPDSDMLFSYAYNEGSPQPIVTSDAETPIQIEADINIAVGTAEHVDAVVSEYSAYASKADFNAHVNANNPHGIDKSAVGLSNVDNTSDTDARPSFTERAGDLVNIQPGETAGTLWGKVKAFFSSYLSHLRAKNPHGTTPKDIGAANENHIHFVTNRYVGNGAAQRKISLNFTPSAVFVCNSRGFTGDDVEGICGGLAIGGYGVIVRGANVNAYENVWSNGTTALLITDGGFYVGYSGSCRTNTNGETYRYIAFK